jgi:hypothetical protein
MKPTLVSTLVLFATVASAQTTPDIPAEKVVIVPMMGEFDGGSVSEPPPQPPPEAPVMAPQFDAPVQPDTRTLEALPPAPPPDAMSPNPPPPIPNGPGAMIDGHPREGAFLSGPGSFTFLMHHTLMTGLGVLATQLIPRAIDAAPHFEPQNDVPGGGCPPITGKYATCSEIVTGDAARLAYLTGTLLGAGIGFTGAAFWQFNHWVSERSANFGIISSLIGGMVLGGFTDLVTKHGDASAITWLTLLGSSAGGWLAAIVGGGDIALNKATLIVSGAGWAMIYTALIVAIVATTGGGITPRGGMDAIMLTPAFGAGLLALATLKFNPSTAQILRANLFGVAVGGAVLLLSGLLLGPATGFTKSPVPYILAGVGAIGAKTVVSLLWADAADSSGVGSTSSDGKYRNVWW